MALDKLEKMNLLKVLRTTKTTEFYLDDILDVVKKRIGINEDIFRFLMEYTEEKLKKADITLNFLEKSLKLTDSFLLLALDDHMPICEELLSDLSKFEDTYHQYIENNTKEETPELHASFVKFEDTIKRLNSVMEKVIADNNLKKDSKGKNSDVDKIKKELEEKLQELEVLLKDKEKELGKKDGIIGDLKADKAKLNNDLALLRGEIKQLLKQIEDLGKYNTGNEQVIENLKSEINSLSQRNNELLERCERLRGEVRAKNDALVEATQENKRLENEERARLVLERKILELLCSRSMSLAEITKYLRDEAYVINEREVYKVIQKINEKVNVTSSSFYIPPHYGVKKPEIVTNGIFDLSNFNSKRSCDLLFISDVHFENCDEDVKRAYEAVYNYAINNKVKVVFNTGDLFNSSLAFQSGIKPENVTKALNIVNDFGENVPFDKNIYQAVLGGNHDKLLLDLGIDSIDLLSQMREDIIPLGYDHCRLDFGGEKGRLALHHPQKRIPEPICDTGYNVSYLLSYMNSYYAREKLSRDDTYIDFIAHFHKSMMDLENSLVVVPSLLHDRYFNGAWHVKIYFDDKHNIDNMIFIPLVLVQDKLLATSEIPYRKSLKK